MQNTPFVVDIETDGPAQHIHSMVWFGVVRLDTKLETVFEGKVHPISEHYIPEALAVCNLTRAQTLTFPKAEMVIPQLVKWIAAHTVPGTKPELWSDNNGFDMGFFNYYLHRFAGHNPFGHTSRNMNDRYRGLMAGRLSKGEKVSKTKLRSFERFIKTPHDHNPVNDAKGNAEALLAMRDLGLVIDVVS